MNSQIRAYFAVTCVGSFLLGGFGVFVQIHAFGLFAGGAKDAGLAGVMFGLVLIGCAVALFRSGRRNMQGVADRAQRKALEPDRPWLWRPDWARGVLVDRSAHPLPAIIVAAMTSLFAMYSGLRATGAGVLQNIEGEVLLVAVSVLAIFLWMLAIAQLRRWTVFGEYRLRLEPIPILPGGSLSGTIVTDLAPSTVENVDVQLALVCNRSYQQNLRHSHSARDAIVWRSSAASEATLGLSSVDAGKVVFPVRFAVPADALTTQLSSESGERIDWKLEVTTTFGRAKTTNEFEVPVFQMPSEQTIATQRSTAPKPTEPQRHATERLSGISVSSAGGRTSISIEPSRQASFAVAAIGFTIAWILAVTYLAVQEAPVVLTVLAALFTVVPVYGAACIILERTEMIVDASGLTIQRSLGPLRYRRRIPAGDVADLFLSSFASVGSTNYFDLILVTKRGRRILLVGRQCGQSLAEWIGFQINAALGRYGRVAFSGSVVGGTSVPTRSTPSIRDRSMVSRESALSNAANQAGASTTV